MAPKRLITGLICGVALLAQASAPGLAQPSMSGWGTFRDKYGTSIPYPRGLFSIEGRESEPPGPVLQTPDGNGQLHIFAVRNVRNERPNQFLKRVFPRQSVGKLSYVRIANNFFVVSEPNNGKALYRRCNFVGQMIHCFDIRYPMSQKRAYDDIVTHMSRSLTPR